MARTSRTRRAAGEGTILRLRDGRYQYRISYSEFGRRRYFSVTARTVSDLLVRRAELENDIKTGKKRQSHGTAGAFFDDWLALMSEQVRASTLAIYTLCLRRLRPYLGGIELARLTAQDVSAAQTALLKEKQGKRLRYKPATVKRSVEVLRNALKQAVAWKLLRENVALGVKPPRVVAFEAYALSELEIRRFLSVIATDRLAPLYHVALRLGMRESELLGLHWSEVDLKTGRLKISQALEVETLAFVEPKSKAGKRTIPLSPQLVSLLENHRRRQLHEKAAFRGFVDRGLVFCTKRGTPIRASNLIRAFKRHLDAAHIPAHVRIHDLRHTCITHMLEQGVPPHVVSAWVGHGDTRITMDVYAHVTERGMLDASEVMERFAAGE